ncbi:hypothetical protein [Cyanobium sp. NS01]|uniref:hypothetical protein n=1 Tax=Cyanobium sp. NS01 TaxID=261284 RepID=UPI001646AEEC|nr:hypothetical protein [Cyanobium sp. NS01]QNI72073.1 hypothetical protein CyaNS01_02981 [Cyanobium sp. NS01]
MVRQPALPKLAAAALAGGLLLSGCQQVSQTMPDAVRDAATATGQAALTPAVTPVLDLLSKGKTELNSGNLQSALATLGGFSALWQKAAPVIQPLAGDKWPMIDQGAQQLISTVDQSNPTEGETSSAISGLMGPLSALIGK